MQKPLTAQETVEALQTVFSREGSNVRGVDREAFPAVLEIVFLPESIYGANAEKKAMFRELVSEVLMEILTRLTQRFLTNRPTAFAEMGERLEQGIAGREMSERDAEIMEELRDSLHNYMAFQATEKAMLGAEREIRASTGMKMPFTITHTTEEFTRLRKQHEQRFMKALVNLAQHAEHLGAERLTGGVMQLGSDQPPTFRDEQRVTGTGDGHPSLSGMRPLLTDIHLLAFALRQLAGRAVTE